MAGASSGWPPAAEHPYADLAGRCGQCGDIRPWLRGAAWRPDGDLGQRSGDTLYYPSYDGSEKNHLVALAPRTGQVTQLTDQPFDTRELAVTHQGFYYTENYDLYCYDYSTGESLLVVDKED